MKTSTQKTQKTTYEQLGIDISVSRVSMCFNKPEENKRLTEILQIIDVLKKKGAIKPVNTLIAPKKPQVSKEEWRESPIRKEYEEKKKLFDAEVRKYEQFSSVEYVKANLAHKLTKKLTAVINLLEKNKETPTPGRTKKIQQIFKELQGGISKPVFGEKIENNGRVVRPIKSRELIMKFTDLGELDETPETLKQRLTEISLEYSETNKLFDMKEEIMNNVFKISENVKVAITFILQEIIYDILLLAMKDCKKSNKFTLTVDNFVDKVLINSPYYPLIHGLPCLDELRKYILRKKHHASEKSKHDAETKKNKQPSMIIKFEDYEKNGGHMEVVNGKKVWKGMSHNANDVKFVTYVGRMFDNLKTTNKIKMKISTKAKDLVSCIMLQFLNVLAQRFDIHRQHRSKILALENKTVKEEKTIKFETAIELFELLLLNNSEKVVETLKKASLLRQKLKELKHK